MCVAPGGHDKTSSPENKLMQAVLLDMEGMTIEALVAVARQGAEARLSAAAEARIAAGRGSWTGGSGRNGGLRHHHRFRRPERRDHLPPRHPATAGEHPHEPCGRRGPPAGAESRAGHDGPAHQGSARGTAGIRLETIQHLAALLNQDVCPVVPEKGSVGASGDLVPLAHYGPGAARQGGGLLRRANGCRGPRP